MSTRCNIHFLASGEIYSNIYRHSDGYPDGEHGVPASFHQFFEELEGQTQDTRYSDPEYLAAKFLVWQASQFARNPEAPLEFLSVSPCVQDHGDIEWVYKVNCDELDGKGRPTLTWRRA
jgi:hypothetical protein